MLHPGSKGWIFWFCTRAQPGAARLTIEANFTQQYQFEAGLRRATKTEFALLIPAHSVNHPPGGM